METIKIIVEDKENGMRIDKLLLAKNPGTSRTQIQGYIQDGNLCVNGKTQKANYKVRTGDDVIFTIPDSVNMDILPQNIPLEIVYEDQDVIVINKPSGMIVHPSAGIYQDTLVNALLYHCKDLSGINGVNRPGIVHRIDKDTSGLLMVAKNDLAHQSLSLQLQNKTVDRLYYALVHGVIEHNYGKIDAPIGRDPNDRQAMKVTDINAKSAVTNFRVVERYKNYTLVECQLETGRTHQIRVHMQYIGHPVVGDPKYGRRKDDTSFGQYLHAKVLGFEHPRTHEHLLFDSDLPEPFIKKIEEIKGEEYWLK